MRSRTDEKCRFTFLRLPFSSRIPGLIWNNLMHTNNPNYSQLLTRASPITLTPLNTGMYNNNKQQGKRDGFAKCVEVVFFSFLECNFSIKNMWEMSFFGINNSIRTYSSQAVKRCPVNSCTDCKQGHPSSDLAQQSQKSQLISDLKS